MNFINREDPLAFVTVYNVSNMRYQPKSDSMPDLCTFLVHKNRSFLYFLYTEYCGLLFLYYMEIHPNAFATELNRIIAAKIGQRYLIIKLNTFFLLKDAPSSVTSSSIFFTPITLEIRRQVVSAAIGIITEFVRKSKKSRNCIPMIFTKPSGPYPREESFPIRS